MKKRLMFALGLIACVAAFTSCGDDDDEPGYSNTCSCQEYDSDTNEYLGSSQLDPSSFNQSSCSQLANHLNNFTQGTYITCR